MAYSIIPSVKWKQILEIQDEVEQSKAALKYVHELECKIQRLEHEVKNLTDRVEDYKTNSSWDCPSWYTDEQRRAFYGIFS